MTVEGHKEPMPVAVCEMAVGLVGLGGCCCRSGPGACRWPSTCLGGACDGMTVAKEARLGWRMALLGRAREVCLC